MKKDIENRNDILKIVTVFYQKLLSDTLLQPIFEEFKDQDKLRSHLEILVDFWDNVLFYSGAYSRNAMQPHLDLQDKFSFTKAHFDRWLQLFSDSVDEHFEGNNSHAIKSRALSIATVMQIKIAENNRQ